MRSGAKKRSAPVARTLSCDSLLALAWVTRSQTPTIRLLRLMLRVCPWGATSKPPVKTRHRRDFISGLPATRISRGGRDVEPVGLIDAVRARFEAAEGEFHLDAGESGRLMD